MAVIAITSAKGSPGVTVTALALAVSWPVHRQVVLVEADPSGTDLMSGYFLAQAPPDRGLLQLSLNIRRQSLNQELWRQVYALDGDNRAFVVPGLVNPVQSSGLVWDDLARQLQDLSASTGLDVIVDCGRMGLVGDPAPIRRRADLLVMAIRPTLTGIRSAAVRIRELEADLTQRGAGAEAVCAVLIGNGPYSAAEVSRTMRVPVVGEVPHDPHAAAVFADGANARRGFDTSPLLRTSRALAASLQQAAEQRRAALGSRSSMPSGRTTAATGAAGVD